MKKLMGFTAVLAIVFCSLLFSSASAQILYKENFETYNDGDYPTGWQNLYSGKFGGVSSDVAYTGAKSYKVIAADNWGRTDYIINPFSLAGIGKLQIEVSFYLLENEQSLHNNSFGLGVDEPKYIGFGIASNKLNAIVGYDTLVEGIADINWNNWYTIKMVIDVVNKKMDFYVNGSLKGDGLDLVSDLSQINNLNLQCPGYDNATIYFDGIVVENITDTDGDGIPDYLDACPQSNLEETIIIDDCDSGVNNQLLEDGCSMNDKILACADKAKNHGRFVSCVSHLTREWKIEELIKGNERGAIQRCAAKSSIPAGKILKRRGKHNYR